MMQAAKEMAGNDIQSCLIDLIRNFHGISPKKSISPESLLETDLGITGDDGCELLEAVEQAFGISFAGVDGSYREAFDLENDEYLFHSESFFAVSIERNVVKLSVGQLRDAILKVMEKS